MKNEIRKKLLADLVNRFLAWRLPAGFNPDGWVSFHNPGIDRASPNWPVGTNLLTAEQAEDMFQDIGQGELEFLVADAARWQRFRAEFVKSFNAQGEDYSFPELMGETIDEMLPKDSSGMTEAAFDEIFDRVCTLHAG